ncbi:MAG: Ig-like domain-containing protein [Planctomycetes bacterium]|nr:Ig-like domain-containing protein [Planctomycetota bacterium]
MLRQIVDEACRLFDRRCRTDTATLAEDTNIVIAVLANDSDGDGDPLTVSTLTQPAHGAAVKNADNTITYTHAAGYTGDSDWSLTAAAMKTWPQFLHATALPMISAGAR